MNIKLVSLVISLLLIIGCTSAKEKAQKYAQKLNPKQTEMCNDLAFRTVVFIASNDANLETMKQMGLIKESKKEWTLSMLREADATLDKQQKEEGHIQNLIVSEIFDDVHGMQSLKDLDLQHRAFVVCAKSVLKEK